MTTQPLSENEPETPAAASPETPDIDDRDLTPEERENADVTLDDPQAGDSEPWSPPETRPVGAAFADADPAHEETIEERILQEETEEGTSYGAPNPAGEGEEAAAVTETDDPTEGLDLPEPEEL